MKAWEEVDRARQEWVAVTLLSVVDAADRLIAESESKRLPARKAQLELDREAALAALERLGYWVREVMREDRT